jgi:hypothetical protein
MASFLLAVCPKCGWYSKPFWEDCRPYCVQCAKDLSPDGKFHIDNLQKLKVPQCRVIEVIPKEKPFSKVNGKKKEKPFTKIKKNSKRRKSPFERTVGART